MSAVSFDGIRFIVHAIPSKQIYLTELYIVYFEWVILLSVEYFQIFFCSCACTKCIVIVQVMISRKQSAFIRPVSIRRWKFTKVNAQLFFCIVVNCSRQQTWSKRATDKKRTILFMCTMIARLNGSQLRIFQFSWLRIYSIDGAALTLINGHFKSTLFLSIFVHHCLDYVHSDASLLRKKKLAHISRGVIKTKLRHSTTTRNGHLYGRWIFPIFCCIIST